MGHLTLISEDVIGALEHLPPDLRLQIGQYAPQPEWDDYVTGRYKETKKKDVAMDTVTETVRDLERASAKAVDFSNGKIMVSIGAVTWLIIVAANVYAIVELAMGQE